MLKKKIFYLLSFKIILISTLYLLQGFIQIYNNVLYFKEEKKIDFYKKNEILIPIFPYTNIKNEKFLPLSLVSNINHINCREDTFWHYVKTDKYGFNNLNSVYETNIKNIFIGDSYTFGNCVKNENNIVKKFDKLSKTNSLNLSMVGNGPLINYATLKEYYPKDKQIKNIIYIFYAGNDLNDIKNHMHNKLLLNYLNDDNFSQNLKSNDTKKNLFLLKRMQDEIKIYKEAQKFHPKEYKKFLTLFDLRLKLKSIFSKKNHIQNYENKVYNIFEKSLINLKEFTLKKNAKLVFVYIPSINYLLTKKYSVEIEADAERIINLQKKHNINFIDMRKHLNNYDLEKIYPPLNDPYTRNRPIHFNEFGYQLIVEKIIDHLKD